MAIKIQGTDVVGSLHDLKNITNTQGLYTTVDRGASVASTPPSSGAGTNISIPINAIDGGGSWVVRDYMSNTALTGITNWRFPDNAEPGFTLTMFVDASNSGHDQTFTWLNSSGHKRNIMNKNMTHIGCGFSYSSDNILYWCVCFGRK